ncbi:MAG TPA: PBP1A family penicillin-binding protein [Beijerinckiaceae bacterium]|nr:PBP1A family penicillin-binding protein [Beijerinckiaceae bacterium]
MQGHRSVSLWTRLKRAALAFDAWVNATLFDSGRGMGEAWERYSERLDKLSVRGPKRVVLDLASEATTLGAAGAVVLLALAIPAFQETHENWQKQQDFAVVFLDRYGQEVGRRGIRHDDSVKLEEFPDHLIKAALATEDRRFFDHWGIDPIGTARALTVNARGGGVVQGGSSITQQLAKNLFLSNERSLERKIKEAFLAIWLEFHLTKNEILKLYLDRAYMGGGNFGAAAAAEFYFGKPVQDLTLAESAMLAGLFKAPSKFAPHVNLPAARARANDVLTNMVDAGFLTEGQIQTARRNPATPIDRGRDTTPDYYLDWAFDEVKKLAAAGKIGQERVLVVKTPLDTAMQRHAEQSLENILRQHGAQYRAEQGALVVMDVDGAVRAIVGGRDYGESEFNRAVHALRQPGSSFKPYVYAAALSTNPRLRPNSTVVDAPICLGNWCPQNYNRSYSGSMPLTTALARSINTIPVRMSVEIGRGNAKAGRAKIIEVARAMGLESNLTDSSSLPIGAAEVTVLDMAAGYAVFANGGKRARPYAALEVRNLHGEVIYSRAQEPVVQVLSSQVVGDMNYMLSQVPEAGTGRRAALDGIRSAGKTGTTNGYRDAWYVGYTGNLVASVWFGNDNYSSTRNMTGGTMPAMLWREVMSFAHQNLELRPLPGLEDAKPLVAVNRPASGQPGAGERVAVAHPGTLSRRSFEVIGGISELLRNAKQPFEAPGPSVAAARAAQLPAGVRAVGGRIAVP